MPVPDDLLAHISSHLPPYAAATLSPQTPPAVLPLHLLTSPPSPAALSHHLTPYISPTSPPLTHLSLATLSLPLSVLTSLLASLPIPHRPTSLDLSASPTLTTLPALQALLPLLPRLRTLRLAANPAVGGAVFFNLISNRPLGLRTLDLSNCPYVSPDDTFAAFPNLTSVVLSPDDRTLVAAFHYVAANSSPPNPNPPAILSISIPSAVASNDAAALRALLRAFTAPLLPRSSPSSVEDYADGENVENTTTPASSSSTSTPSRRRPRVSHPTGLASQLAHAFLTTPTPSHPRGLLHLAATSRSPATASLLVDHAAFSSLLPRACPPLAAALAAPGDASEPLLAALRPRARLALATPVVAAVVELAAARVDDVALRVLLSDYARAACGGVMAPCGCCACGCSCGGEGDHEQPQRPRRRRRGAGMSRKPICRLATPEPGEERTLARAVAAIFDPPAAVAFPRNAAEDDAMYREACAAAAAAAAANAASVPAASGTRWCSNTVLVGRRPLDEALVRGQAGRCVESLLACGVCVENVPSPVLYHASRGGHAQAVRALLLSRPPEGVKEEDLNNDAESGRDAGGGQRLKEERRQHGSRRRQHRQRLKHERYGYSDAVLCAAARRLTERNQRMETLLVTAARGAGDGKDHGALATVDAILEVMDAVASSPAACRIASPVSMREDVADAMVTALTVGHEPLARRIMDRRPDCIDVIVSPRGNSRCALLSIARCIGRASPNERDLIYMGEKLCQAALRRHGHAGLNNWLSTACVDRDGRSVLHFAACASDPFFARYLIQMGSDVNKRDEDGMTPLCIAIGERGSRPCMESLLQAGAGVHVDIGNGRRPLHVAAAAKNGMAEALLMHYGADPLLADRFGVLPMHIDPLLEARSAEVEITSTPAIERCGSSQTLLSSCCETAMPSTPAASCPDSPPGVGMGAAGLVGGGNVGGGAALGALPASISGMVLAPATAASSAAVSASASTSRSPFHRSMHHPSSPCLTSSIGGCASSVGAPSSEQFLTRDDQFRRELHAESFTRNVSSFSSAMMRGSYGPHSSMRVGSCSTPDLKTLYLGSASSESSLEGDAEDEDLSFEFEEAGVPSPDGVDEVDAVAEEVDDADCSRNRNRVEHGCANTGVMAGERPDRAVDDAAMYASMRQHARHSEPGEPQTM